MCIISYANCYNWKLLINKISMVLHIGYWKTNLGVFFIRYIFITTVFRTASSMRTNFFASFFFDNSIILPKTNKLVFIYANGVFNWITEFCLVCEINQNISFFYLITFDILIISNIISVKFNLFLYYYFLYVILYSLVSLDLYFSNYLNYHYQ